MHIKNWKAKKAITKEDIKNGVIHDAVVSEIQQAYDNSEQATEQKRTYHRDIDRKVKQLHFDDRLNYDLLYSYKKSFVAMFQDEGMYPIFEERDYYDQEITDNLNILASEDMKNMNKQLKDQKILSDVFDYGVWLRVYNWYDKEIASPIYITPSPMSRYPDPSGNTIDNNFNYHMFYYETSIAQLDYLNIVSGWFFNLDKVMPNSDDKNNDISNQKSYRNIDSDTVQNWIVWIHNCFITLNWYRYFCVVANDRSLIIKREPLDPKTPEEKEDPTLVPFKISISNAMSSAYDPRWISYREKVYPVQVALKQLTNAIHQKELRNAWFGAHFYDSTRLKNPAYLQEKPSDWPIFIWVEDLWAWPIIQPYGEQEETRWTQEYLKSLEFYAENTTSLTWITRGLAPNSWTLWETEIQMQKSSALFNVDSKSLMKWEQTFRENIRFRCLKENLVNEKKKTMIIWEDNKQAITIWAEDMKKYGNPYLKIVSKREQNEKNQRKVTSMQAFFPILLQDQSAAPITKKIFKRELMKLQWLDKSFIYSVEQLTPSERHAKMMVEVINLWEKPKNLIKPWVDLETLWIYINKARDNNEKQQALNVLNSLMIKNGTEKQQSQWWEMQWLANSMASQAMWSEIQQGKKDLLSI